MTATAAPDDAVGTAAHRRRWSWRAQVLSLLVVVLVAALSVAVGGALYVVRTSVAEETETIEEVAEPFLVRLGFMMRTPRGRIATPAGWAHLGMVPPTQEPAGGQPDLFS